MNSHWLVVRNILKYCIDLFLLLFFYASSQHISPKTTSPLTHRGWYIVQKGMKAWCWLCTLQEETEKAGGGVCVCVCGDAVAFSRLTSFSAN